MNYNLLNHDGKEINMTIDNWKYNEWKKIGYSSSTIVDYISYEIYPEDIEIFSIILLPKTIIYKDRILIKHEWFSEDEVRSRFDRMTIDFGIDGAERFTNWIRLSDLFIGTVDKSSPDTLLKVINLIKFNWQYMLLEKYPDREFIIDIWGEEFSDPEITFYEKKS